MTKIAHIPQKRKHAHGFFITSPHCKPTAHLLQ